MKKHAYLVIAHNNFEQLRYLFTLIDDKRNDIFLFVDKKSSGEFNGESIKLKYSNFKYYSPFSVNWGGVSLCRATLLLLKKALKTGSYSYFHLISGADLPLHSQDYIHEFFERYEGYEFLAYVGKEIYERELPEERLKYYYIFQDAEIKNKTIKTIAIKIWNKCFVKLQKCIGVNRTKKYGNIQYGYGTQWFSITAAFAEYIASQEEQIERMYKNSFCSDEVFVHTLALNSKFKDKIFITEGLNDKKEDRQGSLRYINWWDGTPKVWTSADKEELNEARERGYLFSRKFDERLDRDIIEYIGELVKNENNFTVTDHL